MLRIRCAVVFIFLCSMPSITQAAAQAPPATSKRLSLAQVWAIDATYRDPERGVTFRYPSVWEPETQFGYHPPAIAGSGSPLAGFGYEESGFPRRQVVSPYSQTNLEGFGIVYSAFTSANARECEGQAAEISGTNEHGLAVFRHRSFDAYKTGEAGMSQSTGGTLYSTYTGSTCYLFEIDVSTASADAVDGIAPLTSAQYHEIRTNLLGIMKTVRIAFPNRSSR